MKLLFILSVISSVLFAQARLQDSEFFNYDVIFTNPICQEYIYTEAENVVSNDGALLRSKPKNVYCKNDDKDFNEAKVDGAHQRLLTLINNESVSKIFLTYLSFSNEGVKVALCNAAKRGVSIKFIIDSKGETRAGARENLDELAQCSQEGEVKNYPEVFFRGNIKGLGFAHNKIILAEYKDSKKVNLVYGSANMSSGTSMHHENWHFVTTHKDTYFVAHHECVKEGMLNFADSRKSFKQFMKTCRSEIIFEKESDIEMFVVPSDGKIAMQAIKDEAARARSMKVAAHRFSHPDLIKTMINSHDEGKLVQFVSDDDIYWTGVRNTRTGFNTYGEFLNVLKLVKAGVEVKYMETNQNFRFLHHNKYILFEGACEAEAVFSGAGNFTKSAFYKNFENFYMIKIPSVVKAFKKQYNHVFYKLATSYEMMPKQYVMP